MLESEKNAAEFYEVSKDFYFNTTEYFDKILESEKQSNKALNEIDITLKEILNHSQIKSVDISSESLSSITQSLENLGKTLKEEITLKLVGGSVEFVDFLQKLTKLDIKDIDAAVTKMEMFFKFFSEERTKELKEFNEQFKTTTEILDEIAAIKDKDLDKEDSFKSLSIGVGILSTAILAMAAGFKFLGWQNILGAVVVIGVVTAGLVTASLLAQKTDTEGFRELATAILIISGAVGILAIISKFMDWGDILKTVVMMGVVVGAAVGLSILLSKTKTTIATGSLSLIVLGFSILAFSGLIYASTRITELVNWKSLGLLILTTTGLSLLYVLLAKVSIPIALGAVAIIALGASLFVAAFAFQKASESVDNISFANLGTFAKYLLITGGTFAAVGLLTPFIIGGSVAIFLMSGSLWFASFAFKRTGDQVENIAFSRLDEFSKFILDYGKTFARTALMAPLIAIGAGAVILMSASLLIFSFAVNRINRLRIDPDRIADFQRSLHLLYDAIAIPLIRPSPSLRTVGAGSAALVGMSLATLAILPVLRRINDLQLDQEKFDQFTGIISDMGVMFGEFGAGRRFFGFGPSEISSGVRTLANAGTSITNIIEGIRMAQDVQLTQQEWRTIQGMISQVPELFAGIETRGGLHVFGRTIRMNDVQKGIKSVQGIGNELLQIAQGLKLAAEIELGDPDDPNSDFGRIHKTIATLPQLFADFGEGRGWWGLRASDAQKGIRSVKGISDALKAIFEGFRDEEFADHQNFLRVSEGLEKISNLKDPIAGMVSELERMNTELSRTVDIINDLDDMDSVLLREGIPDLRPTAPPSPDSPATAVQPSPAITTINNENVEVFDGEPAPQPNLGEKLDTMITLFQTLIQINSSGMGSIVNENEDINRTLKQMLNEMGRNL